jgi:hypothetical protein
VLATLAESQAKQTWRRTTSSGDELPVQGHTNPMLEFGRRLAYDSLCPTGLPPGAPFHVAAIFDGFDIGGMGSCPDPVEYCRKAEAMSFDAGGMGPCMP